MNLILNLSPGDYSAMETEGYLHNTLGYEVITETHNLDKLAEVGMGEKLIIVGHGTVDKMGGPNGTKYNAGQVADILAKGGLSGKVEIELYACETGLGRAPFALNLKVALIQSHKIMSSVSAPRGWLSIEPGGHLAVEQASGMVPDNKAFFKIF